MKFTKSILALTLGAITLVSCNKISAPDTTLYPDDEIRFENTGILVETKTFAEATGTTLQSNGFMVAAIIDADNSAMFNKAVSYDSGTSAYSVSGEHYYWPVTGTMSFYAAYPQTQAVTVTSGVASLSYAQNADTDLIVAKATAVSKQSTAVALTFDHILSQVEVKAQGAGTNVDYKVYSVTITDANGGTYAYADGKWTPSSTTQAYSVYSDASGMTVSTSGMTKVGSEMSFVPGDVKLNVKWKCYNKNSGTVVADKDVTVDTTLTKGKKTTFNLTLPFDSSELLFTATVSAWGTESKNISMTPAA